ncbi:MAG: TatD family hydrolase, partial [bacterium]|nr:TatD family hydrolase [bacterium]
DEPFFVDTHAHLYYDKFDHDRDLVINNAMLASVSTIINVGVDLKTSRQSLELAERYEMVYAAAGIHPNDSHLAQPEDHWGEIEHLFQHPKLIAVGEIGLDYHWDFCPPQQQKQALIRQLELAIEYDLPVIIHTREAWRDILSIINRYRDQIRGVFHCFSGTAEQAKQVLDLGFYISFTGVVTFKNSAALKLVADFVPLDRLLLETDSPFMAPVPFRGKRCEPAYTPLIAKKIAEAKGIGLSEIALRTTENAQNLFQIKLSGIGK